MQYIYSYLEQNSEECKIFYGRSDGQTIARSYSNAKSILPSTSSAASGDPQTPRQTSIEDSLESGKQMIQLDPRSQIIYKYIAEMIALDNQPLSILENVGFTRLMSTLRPKYQIPNKKYVSEIIPQLYDKLKKMVINQLSIAKTISVTSDMQTCTNNFMFFLSFTAHCIDNNFSLQHRMLAMKSFTEQHTARNIRYAFKEVADETQIFKTPGKLSK